MSILPVVIQLYMYIHTNTYLYIYICIYIIYYTYLLSFIIPDSAKKQPPTWNHRDTLLTPATPNFNVVCDRKWRASSTEMVIFLEGRQTQNSEDNIELGTGGTCPLWCGTSWDGCFFEEPGMYPLTWKPRNAVWKTGRWISCWPLVKTPRSPGATLWTSNMAIRNPWMSSI